MQIFSIDFKNLSQLFQILGYARPMSKNFIAQKYGSLENLIKTRLGVENDDQAMQQLQLLKEKFLESQIKKNECIADPAVLSILITCYKQTDQHTRTLIIESVASALSENKDQIQAKLDQLAR